MMNRAMKGEMEMDDNNKRGSCVDCEEEKATWRDKWADELCSTCLNIRIKDDPDNNGYKMGEFNEV